MHHEFVLRSLEPFVTVRQWVVLRDTNKTMNTLCSSIQTRTKQEDQTVLRCCLHVIWPRWGSGLSVHIPATNEYCRMREIHWNNEMNGCELRSDNLLNWKTDQNVNYLKMESLVNPNGLFYTNFPREHVVQIGSIRFKARLEETYLWPFDLISVIISLRDLRVGLGELYRPND